MDALWSGTKLADIFGSIIWPSAIWQKTTQRIKKSIEIYIYIWYLQAICNANSISNLCHKKGSGQAGWWLLPGPLSVPETWEWLGFLEPHPYLLESAVGILNKRCQGKLLLKHNLWPKSAMGTALLYVHASQGRSGRAGRWGQSRTTWWHSPDALGSPPAAPHHQTCQH